MRCKTCHYSLQNLTGPPHRCPECGNPFDPNDPSTFDIRPTEAERWPDRESWPIRIAITAGWICLAAVVAFLVDWPRNLFVAMLFYATVGWLIESLIVMLVRKLRARRDL